MTLLVLAFVCFVLSALRTMFSPRIAAIDFVAIGLACWVLSYLWMPVAAVPPSWPIVALVISVLSILILLVRQRVPKAS